MSYISDESLSMSAMALNFKDDGLTRTMILRFLEEEKKYIFNIREATPLGLSNGVSYKYKEEYPSQKWPVYDKSVQKLINDNINVLKELYPELVLESSKKRISKMPAGISVDDYPCIQEIKTCNFDSFVAYDFETTGFSSSRDAIIEIGAIKVENGIINESKEYIFQEFVRPYKKSVSSTITEITGITKQDVADARPFWEVIPDFMNFVGDNIMVGFNNVSFDSKFLERAGRKSEVIIKNKQFDVMRYAKKLGYTHVSLAEMSNELNIVNPRAHRALADAITTARILLKLK